jgi:hypothetical protein
MCVSVCEVFGAQDGESDYLQWFPWGGYATTKTADHQNYMFTAGFLRDAHYNDLLYHHRHKLHLKVTEYLDALVQEGECAMPTLLRDRHVALAQLYDKYVTDSKSDDSEDGVVALLDKPVEEIHSTLSPDLQRFVVAFYVIAELEKLYVRSPAADHCRNHHHNQHLPSKTAGDVPSGGDSDQLDLDSVLRTVADKFAFNVSKFLSEYANPQLVRKHSILGPATPKKSSAGCLSSLLTLLGCAKETAEERVGDLDHASQSQTVTPSSPSSPSKAIANTTVMPSMSPKTSPFGVKASSSTSSSLPLAAPTPIKSPSANLSVALPLAQTPIKPAALASTPSASSSTATIIPSFSAKLTLIESSEKVFSFLPSGALTKHTPFPSIQTSLNAATSASPSHGTALLLLLAQFFDFFPWVTWVGCSLSSCSKCWTLCPTMWGCFSFVTISLSLFLIPRLHERR